ncbi:MAG: PLP-dependent aminotransferase family protein [Thermoanaerobaculia bacterium]
METCAGERGAGRNGRREDFSSRRLQGNRSLPIASLQGLDRDSRVIYIGTFTKILFPALRLGYLVVPPDLVEAFVEVRRAMDFGPPTFLQMVLTDFIGEGHFARHIRRTRLVCQERRGALVAALARELPELRVLGDPAGMYLAVALPRGWRDREISERAAREGLWVAPLSEFYLGAATRQGLVLGYGGSNVEEIEAGVARLRDVIATTPERAGERRIREEPRRFNPHRPSG